MTAKFIFCVGGNLMPVSVDDWRIKHDSALIIENSAQPYNFRISLGMDRDDELSRPYEPYYARVLSLEKMKQLRDSLTTLIEMSEKME